MSKAGGKGKKAGRNVKSAAHARYNSERRDLKNKARRQEKHQKKLAKQQEKKAKRLELLELCKSQTKMRVGDLQKKFGTLNIKRLTDILEQRYENSPWYINRKTEAVASTVAKKIAIKKSRRERKKSKRRADEKVSKR